MTKIVEEVEESNLIEMDPAKKQSLIIITMIVAGIATFIAISFLEILYV